MNNEQLASLIVSIIACSISAISVTFAIIAFFRSVGSANKERKNLTIDQYHHIAYGDGPLCWFYHMTDTEYKHYLSLARGDHDSYRNSGDKDFLVLEDKLGELDEYASAINSKLYDYKTFKILAFNYCSKRVTPKLVKILKHYKKGNYKNIKMLVNKMDPKAKLE